MNTSAGHLIYDWINIELIHVKEPESYVLWCYRGTAIQTPLLATAVSPLPPPPPAAPLPRCPAVPFLRSPETNRADMGYYRCYWTLFF